MTRKEKKTRGDTDGTIILFLYPLIFDTTVPPNNVCIRLYSLRPSTANHAERMNTSFDPVHVCRG